MTEITEFLFPAPAPRSVGAIFSWWERRRVAYNLVVGGAGMLSLVVAQLFALLPPSRFQIVPYLVVIPVGIAANVFYFLGPMVESAAYKAWGTKLLPLGPALYRAGLTFSVGLVLLPTLIAPLDWAIRIVRWLVG